MANQTRASYLGRIGLRFHYEVHSNAFPDTLFRNRMQLRRVIDITTFAIQFAFFNENQTSKIAELFVPKIVHPVYRRACIERRTKNEFILDRITRTTEDAVRPQLRIHLVGKGKSNSAGIE